jgi:hypothetical protein
VAEDNAGLSSIFMWGRRLWESDVYLPMLLRHHDKDMSAVYDVPVAPLVIPISVLMSVPIRVVVVVVGMHRGTSSRVDSSAARTVYHLGGIGLLWRCDYSSEQRQGQN